jgi:hypothetical protein
MSGNEWLPEKENLMRRNPWIAAALLAVAFANADAGDDAKKAQAQVEDHVKKLLNKDGFRRITPIEDESLKKLQPGSHFFGVLFPQYPIGIDPPAPLKVGNVFVVDKTGRMVAIPDIENLQTFVKANFPVATTEADANTTLRAWLMLSQHIHGDGYYQFELGLPFQVQLDDAKKPTRAEGVARVKPMGGNKGQITVALAFGGNGKLASVKDVAKLVEGIRPICQATRLLDPDPLVRKMAERDLLVMGRTCEEYLITQRAKASPDLRREIDRVWQQILDEDR